MNVNDYYSRSRNTETIIEGSKEKFKEVFNTKTEHFEIKESKPKKYKTKIKITSLLAYSQILENLGQRQALVFGALRKLKSANSNMISKYLNIPINEVVPRIFELRSFGIVKAHKKSICPITQKLTIFWKPRNWEL